MSILASDGLSLTVGDGETEENFTTLRGMTISRLEITQQLADSTTIGEDAWSVGVGALSQRALIECEAMATNETAAVRIRALALSGEAGNFHLASSASETVAFQAFVTQYQEITQPGAIKRLSFRLESSGAVIVA